MRMRTVILLIFVTYLTRVSAAPLAKRSNSTPFFGNYAQGYVKPNWIFGEGTKGGKLVGDRKRIKINGQPYEQWKVVPLSFVIEHQDKLPKQKIGKRSYDDQLTYQKETSLPQGSTQFETEKIPGHASTMIPNKRKLYVRDIKRTNMVDVQERERKRIIDKLDPSRLDEQNNKKNHHKMYTSIEDTNQHEDEVSTSGDTVIHDENSSMYDEDEHIFGFISDESTNDDVDDVDDSKVRGILNRIKSPSKLKPYKSNWKPTKSTQKVTSPTLNNSEFMNKNSKLPKQNLVEPGESRKQPLETLTPTGQTTKTPNSINHDMNNENGSNFNSPIKSENKISNNSEGRDELRDIDDKPIQRSLYSSNEIHPNSKNPSPSDIAKEKYGNPNDSIPITSKKFPSNSQGNNNDNSSLANPNINPGWENQNRNEPIKDALDDNSSPQSKSGNVPKNMKATQRLFSKKTPNLKTQGEENANEPIYPETIPIKFPQSPDGNSNINDGDIENKSSNEESTENIWNTKVSKPANGDDHNDKPREENRNNLIPEDQIQKISSNEESLEDIWNTGVPKRPKNGITGFNQPREENRNNLIPEDQIQKISSNEESLEDIWNTGVPKRPKNGITGFNRPREGKMNDLLSENQYNDSVQINQNENKPDILDDNGTPLVRSGENPQKIKTIKKPYSNNPPKYTKLEGKNIDAPINSEPIPIKPQQSPDSQPNINNSDTEKPISGEESLESIWNTGKPKPIRSIGDRNDESLDENNRNALPKDINDDSFQPHQGINNPEDSDFTSSPQSKSGKILQKNGTGRNPISKNPFYLRRKGEENKSVPINLKKIPVKLQQIPGGNPNINEGDIQTPLTNEESLKNIWNTEEEPKSTINDGVHNDEPQDENSRNALPKDINDDSAQTHQGINNSEDSDFINSPQSKSGKVPQKNETDRSLISKNPLYLETKGRTNKSLPIDLETIPIKTQQLPGGDPSINDGEKPFSGEESLESIWNTEVNKPTTNESDHNDEPRNEKNNNALPEDINNNSAQTHQGMNNPTEKSPNFANKDLVDDGTVSSNVLLNPPITSIPNEMRPINPNYLNSRKQYYNKPIFPKSTHQNLHTLPGDDPIFNDSDIHKPFSNEKNLDSPSKHLNENKLISRKSSPNTGSLNSENNRISNEKTNPDMTINPAKSSHTPSTSILNNQIKKKPITSEVNPSKSQTNPNNTYHNVFGDIPSLESDEKNNDGIQLSEKNEPNMDKSAFPSIDSLGSNLEGLSDKDKEPPDYKDFTQIPTTSILGNRKKVNPINSEDNSVKSKAVPETDTKNVFGDLPTLFSSEENSNYVESPRNSQTLPQNNITDDNKNINHEVKNTNKLPENDYNNTSIDNSNVNDQQQPKIASEEPNSNKLSKNSELNPDKSTSPTINSLDSEPNRLNDKHEPNILSTQGKIKSVSSEDKPEESLINLEGDSQNMLKNIPLLNSSEEVPNDIWETKKPPDDITDNKQNMTPQNENTDISPGQNFDNASKDNPNQPLLKNSQFDPDESTSLEIDSLDSKPHRLNDSREPNILSNPENDKSINSVDKPEESKINPERDSQNTFGNIPLLNSSEEVPDDIWKKPPDDITDDKQNVALQNKNTSIPPGQDFDGTSKNNSKISDQQQPESNKIEPIESNPNTPLENKELNPDETTSSAISSLDSEPDKRNNSHEPNIFSNPKKNKSISSKDEPERDSQNTIGDIPLLKSNEGSPDNILWKTKKPPDDITDDKQNIIPQDENTKISPKQDYNDTSKENSKISDQQQPESNKIEPIESNPNTPLENKELNPDETTSSAISSLDSEPDKLNNSHGPNIFSNPEKNKSISSEDESERDSQNTIGDIPLLKSNEESPGNIWDTGKSQADITNDKQSKKPQDENMKKSPEQDYDNTSNYDSNIIDQSQPESNEIEPEIPNLNKSQDNSELNPDNLTSPVIGSTDFEPDRLNDNREPTILSNPDKNKSISSEDKSDESKINPERDSQTTFGDIPPLKSIEKSPGDIFDKKKPQYSKTDNKKSAKPQDQSAKKKPEQDYNNTSNDNSNISDQRQSKSNETESGGRSDKKEIPNSNKPPKKSKTHKNKNANIPTVQDNSTSKENSEMSALDMSEQLRPESDKIGFDGKKKTPNSNKLPKDNHSKKKIHQQDKNAKIPTVQNNNTSKDNSEMSALDMSEQLQPEYNEMESDDEIEPHNIYKTSQEKNMDNSAFFNPEIGIPNVSVPSKPERKKPTNSKAVPVNPQNIVGSMSNNKIGDISILNPDKKILDETTKIPQNTINGSSSSDVPRKKIVNNYSSGNQSNIYKEFNPDIYKNSPTNFIDKSSSKRMPKTKSNKPNNDSNKITTPSFEVSGGTPNPSINDLIPSSTIPVSEKPYINNDQIIANYLNNSKLQNKIPKDSPTKLDTDPGRNLQNDSVDPTFNSIPATPKYIMNTVTSKPKLNYGNEPTYTNQKINFPEHQGESSMNANQNMQPSGANAPIMPDFPSNKGFNPYGYMIPKFNTNTEDENSNYNIWASSPPKQKNKLRLNEELGNSNDEDNTETAKKPTTGSYHSNVISNQVNLDKNLNTKPENLKSDSEKSDNNKSNDKNGIYDEFIKNMTEKVLSRIEDIDGKISKLEKNRSENNTNSRDNIKTDDLKITDSSSWRENTTKSKKEKRIISSESDLDESSSDSEKLNSSDSDENNDIKQTKKTNKSKRNKNKKNNKSRKKASNAAKKKNTERQYRNNHKKHNKDVSESKEQSKDKIKRSKSRKKIKYSSEDDSSETDDSSSDKSAEYLKYKRKQKINSDKNTNSTKKKLKRTKTSKNRHTEGNTRNDTTDVNNNRRDLKDNHVTNIRNNDVNLMKQKKLGSNTNKKETEINITEDNTEADDGYKLVRFYPQYSYTNPLQRLFSMRRPPAYRGILS